MLYIRDIKSNTNFLLKAPVPQIWENIKGRIHVFFKKVEKNNLNSVQLQCIDSGEFCKLSNNQCKEDNETC